MRAGKLRHLIDIEQRSTGQDVAGQQLGTWTPVVSRIYANVKPVRTEEPLNAAALRGRVTHEVELRYRAGVTAAMRVKFGTRYFDIIGVRDTEERHRQLFLDCVEGMSDG